MKRIVIIVSIALAIMGCTQTSVQPVVLKSKADSANYALGYVHGNLHYHLISQDSTGAALTAFMRTFDHVAAGQLENQSKAFKLGHQLGISIQQFQYSGLTHYALWPANEPLILQGFVDGYYGDTTIMTRKGVQNARNRAGTIHKGWAVVYDPVQAESCPYSVQPVVMENKVDTINYAFGWSNGMSFRYQWSQDSLFVFEDCVKGINVALKHRPAYPDAVVAAERLALQSELWAKKGLDGKNFLYKSDIYRQALVNGLQKDTTSMTFDVAVHYINDKLPACLPPSARHFL